MHGLFWPVWLDGVYLGRCGLTGVSLMAISLPGMRPRKEQKYRFQMIPDLKLTRFWNCGIQIVTGFVGMVLCAPWMDLDDFWCIFKLHFHIFTF